MRLWSLHPKYLDAKGLVALWREALLAKHVLKGKTKGYRNHPQLIRFKQTLNPLVTINKYLGEVYNESLKRGYRFNKRKIGLNFTGSKPGKAKLTVTKGQMEFEAIHLLGKLRKRDKKKYRELLEVKKLAPHPLFKTKKGNVEEWEKI